MRAEVRFHPEADADLNNLFEYLRTQASARVAGDYVRRIHAACLALETFPHRGAPRPDVGRGIRVLGFERRVSILYRVDDNAVAILGVFYGGRDIRSFAEDDA
jgi:toxin ParE1/3/4